MQAHGERLRTAVACRMTTVSIGRSTPSLGVALGGGSARGLAHIGALVALERHGLRPDVVVGTSFGAVVGAIYASGRPLDTFAAEAERLRRRDVFPHVADLGVHRGALFSGVRLEAYFERLLEGRDFADLERPFAVVATDVATGERVLLRKGSLARALRASSSLPGLFAPVEIEGRHLIDGGIGSPVPVATLAAFDVDVAVGIGAGVEFDRSRSIGWLREVLGSTQGVALQHWLRGQTAAHGFGRLALGLGHVAEAWTTDDDSDLGVAVHTRPPVSWLGFHRGTEAIAAGAAALDASVGAIRAACATAATR